MTLALKDRNGNSIKLNEIDKINELIAILKFFTEKNPTKEAIDKWKSLMASETFHTLFTEGEISSRRNIQQIFNRKEKGMDDTHRFSREDEKIGNFFEAYRFVFNQPPTFSIPSIFNLYSLISLNIIDPGNMLKDNEMFRSEPVYISSNQSAGDFQGFDPKNIEDCLRNLCTFLNEDSDMDLYLKAIIGHIYFEMIHPYYDFNGRTGRFIPLWLFAKNRRHKEMMYFATAIGNFKEQYRSIFNTNIDHRTYEVNMDKMVIKLLILLITNQHQYIWLKNAEPAYIAIKNKPFTTLQKNFIWRLMNKLEITNSTDSWMKFDEKDKEFVDIQMRQATFSEDTNDLKRANIIQITDSKPRRYKLNSYNLCQTR